MNQIIWSYEYFSSDKKSQRLRSNTKLKNIKIFTDIITKPNKSYLTETNKDKYTEAYLDKNKQKNTQKYKPKNKCKDRRTLGKIHQKSFTVDKYRRCL